MKHWPRVLICLLFSPVAVNAEITGGIRVDMEVGAELRLQAYNGPDIDISVKSHDMVRVNFALTNHEKSVPVARTNISEVDVNRSGMATVFGTNHVELKPLKSYHSIEIGTGGFTVKNSNREAYLLYSDVSSGLRVYWFDVLDTKQNEIALLIVPAPRPAAETALLSDAEKLKAIDGLEAAGLLSAAEARAKRASIIGAH